MVSSSVGTHVCDFEHRLSILFHEVHLVCVTAIDVLHPVSDVVFAWVEVLRVRVRGNVSRWATMGVGWEDLCESIPHL